MTQDLNQQFDNPELFSNQEPVIQPAESSLFELDLIPKANTPKMEMDEDIKQDKTAKAVYETLAPIEGETKVGVYVDDNGKMYDEKSDEVKQSLRQMEFPDPPTEEEKKQRLADIQQKMNNEIAELDAQANTMFERNDRGLRRKKKWMERETKEVQKKYEDEYDQYLGLKAKDYTKKSKTEKDILYTLSETGRKLQTQVSQTNNLIKGIDFNKISLHEKDNVNPELEKMFEETASKGITTYEAFYDALEKGKIQDGAILRIEDDRGYKSNVRSQYSKPVYYRASIDKDGNKSIEKAAEGVRDPLTGAVLGGQLPVTNLSAIDLKYDYSTITYYDNLRSNIESRTDLKPEEKSARLKNLDSERNKNLGNLGKAYDELVSPYSQLSNPVKMAIIASTYPNQFKEKYTQATAESKSAEDAADRVLRAFGGILVSPVTGVTAVAGAAEKGITEVSRLMQGKPEGVIPTGTLALEIKKNPDLAKYIDEAIKEAGPRANMYLNSVEGLANLVSTAKAKMNNKDIESILAQARAVYPQIVETLQSFSNTSKRLNVNISAYQSGVLNLLNTSGYNAALNDYKNALTALENNDNKDVRDAFRYIKYQSMLLNPETPFSENLAKLKPEEVEFINKIGKELRFNKSDILGMTYDEATRIYELGNRAKNLYPADAIKEYEAKNRPALDQAINEYTQQEQVLKNSEIFSEKGKFLLSRLNEIDDEYNSAFSDTNRYSFPILSQDEKQMKNALAYVNPLYGMGIGVINGIGDILGGLRETGQKLTGFSWDGFDANSRNVAYSLGEYKRHLETSVGKTGNYAFDIANSIGSAFPQMVGFAGSFIAGGPIGGAGYLAATMTGPKMREAADAGLGDMGQATYALLSMGIEYGSELITSEAALFKSARGKSVLTKDLVERIMAPKTRKEAFKEYANLLWKKGARVTVQGTLEAFEEEVANKGNYILQNFYNSMMNTSFNPSVFTLQESADTLLTMIGTSVLFKGAVSLKQMTMDRTPQEEAKRELAKQGMDKVSASIMASLTTNEGVARALDIVKRVESGQIKESELNMPVYQKVRDVLIPAAMSLNFSPNLSVQQRTVALDNIVKADEMSRMVERGEMTSEQASVAIQTFNQNAQKALTDVEYANKEFGIDSTEMKSMIFDYFGMADIATNNRGALDARTPEQMEQQQAPTVDMTPLDRNGLIGQLNNLYVTDETNPAVAKAAETAIRDNPEGFIASEIQNAKNLIEKAKVDYELAAQNGPAGAELARIDNLTDNLNNLENLKLRYLNSQQDATQISTRPQQEGGQPSSLVQRQGTQEGQPQEGERARQQRQEEERSPDYRNRNFGSQARQAVGEVRQMFTDAGVGGMYAQPIQPGQEVQYMDELASQVLIDEPAVVNQFGQQVADRLKQYAAQTNLTTELPVVRAAQQRFDSQRVADARASLLDAITRANKTPIAANKKAVKSLVDRLKQAFPNVKVVMDKKGFQEALKDQAARDLMTKGGVVYGRVLNGEVYLNPDYANYNTPIHEFGHLWLNAAKEIAPAVYNRGRELIRDSEYMAKLQADPLYDGLTGEELENEALATAIGDRGEQFVNEAQKQGFKNWMRRLLRKMAQYVGIFNLSKLEIDSLTLDEFLNRANASLLAGEAVTFNKMSDRSQFMARPEGLSIVDGWYSPIERRLLETKIEKQSANKWLGIVGSKDEAIYTGVKGWLEGKNPQEQVSKQEILDWMRDNRVEIVEISKGGVQNAIDKRNELIGLQDRLAEMGDFAGMDAIERQIQDLTDDIGGSEATKYSQYQLPGDKSNYKEVLVTLPSKKTPPDLNITIKSREELISDKNNYSVEEDGKYFIVKGLRGSRKGIEKDNLISTKEKAIEYYIEEQLAYERGDTFDVFDKEGKYVETVMAPNKERAKEIYIGRNTIEEKAKFKSTHFGEANILVHLRMNTRTDADGNKVLFLEEIQSDWGQKGKREGFFEDIEIKADPKLNGLFVAYYKSGKKVPLRYNGESVTALNTEEKVREALRQNPPTGLVESAPFVTDTNAWTKLGLKMALREAVAQGADKIAWTTGEQQNERYDLAKQVDYIDVFTNDDGTYQIEAVKGNDTVSSQGSVKANELEGFFGKDLANKIIEDTKSHKHVPGEENLLKTYRGDDLKVGGKGMKGFYDKIVPDVAKALVKELTGKQGEVGETKIAGEEKIKTKYNVVSNINNNVVAQFNTGQDAVRYISKNEEIENEYRVVSADDIIKTQSTQQSVDVTPELSASVREGMPMFMARQQEPSFKKQMIDLANAVMQRELNKGRTLEEARAAAVSDVSSAVIANTTGKFNNNAVQKQIEQFVEQAYNEQKASRLAAARQRRINQAFTNPEAQKIVESANRVAELLRGNNVSAKEAYKDILSQVKANIERMYSTGTMPANVSWIDMMSLAPAIASDAVRAAFPASRTQQFEGEEMVNMTTSQWIRNAVSNQIRAIKDVKDRAKKIEAAVKDILKAFEQRYGKGVQLTKGEINAIIKDINDNVFSREDVLSAVDSASAEVSKVIEKAYRRKLITDTKNLIDRLKSASKTKFSTEFFEKVKSITDSDFNQLPGSDISLEDLSRLNENIKNILNGNLNAIQPTIDILSNVNPTNQQRIRDEHISLLSKMKNLTTRAANEDLNLMDYKELLRIQRAIEDVKERKGNIAALTPGQQREIMQQYGVLMLTPFANVNDVIAQREGEIKVDALATIDRARTELASATSDLRDKIRNGLMYDQFIRMMSVLSDDYLASLSPKDMLELSADIDQVLNYGNYNNRVYNQYVKAIRYKLRSNGRAWGENISARRNKIAAPGLTGFIVDKFRRFRRTFTDVEGATPSADAIAKNLDLLKITALDAELYSGEFFDELNMGFLEREVFAPMAMAIDAAMTKTQAKLGQLQQAMLSFSDKSNNETIKKAVGRILADYNLGGTVLGTSLRGAIRKGYAGAFFADISTRMAAIVAHQIDYISNLEGDQKPIDMVLQRNIFDVKKGANGKPQYLDKTMFEYFNSGAASFAALAGDFNKYYDAIAYAALTNSGKDTLADKSAEDLMNLLTDKQKEGLEFWREHINNNAELFEAAQIVSGNMRSSIKNYFPRRVLSSNNISDIQDSEAYLNGQYEAIGLESGQMQTRQGEVGRLDLDGNKVLLHNMKALHLMHEVKPYLDYIKGLEDSINDIKTDPRGANEFATAYLEGISKAAKERLNNSLLTNDRSINDNFHAFYKMISSVQSFASRVWLISVTRQLFSDFPANIGKLATALAFENKKLSNQAMGIFSGKSKFKTDKGSFVWDDYVEIARLTGSPVYKVMSIYADNFLYEYKKTPEELQRQQRVSSWQDMAVKKRAWMSRFEEAFKRITGEYLDHNAFKDERGVYRALNLVAVERAAAAADSFVDNQLSLPSFTRQPLKRQVLAPFFGRGLRNMSKSNKRLLSMSRDNPLALITGFLQGYPTTQFQLFHKYMRLSFSTTSGLSIGERSAYFTRGVLEGALPVFVYTLTRNLMSIAFMSSAYAIMSAAGDDEEAEKMFDELETKEGFEKYMYKVKIAWKKEEDKLMETIINSFSSVAIDPQAAFGLRSILGLTVFAYWKNQAVAKLVDMDKDERSQAKRKIKQAEDMWFNIYQIKPFVLYGTENYDQAIASYYDKGRKTTAATKDWEMLLNSIGGIGALYEIGKNTYNFNNLMSAAEGETQVDKTTTMVAAGLQAYGLLFANLMIGGKFGPFLNMVSGDANKLGKYLQKEELSKYEEEKRENQDSFMIEVEKKKGKGEGRLIKEKKGSGRLIKKKGGKGRLIN